MKKLTKDQIIIHDLMNHLHQIQLICENSRSSEILDKVNMLRQEAEASIDLAKMMRSQGPENNIQELSGKEFCDYFTDYLSSRNVKMKLVPEKNAQLYRVKINSGVHSVMGNLVQNLERHGDNLNEVELRFKAIGEYILVALKNKKSKKVLGPSLGIGLESIEDYCVENGGKARFSQDADYFYTRLFFPIIADCPAVTPVAA